MSIKIAARVVRLPPRLLLRQITRPAYPQCSAGPTSCHTRVPYRQFWRRSGAAAQPAQHAHAEPTEADISIHDNTNMGQLEGASSNHVTINIDGNSRVFDKVFLRDSCTCPQCMDPDSKQKLFQTSDIPQDIEASYRTIEDPEKGLLVELEWSKDVPHFQPGHRTRHSMEWLRRALDTELQLRGCVRSDDRVMWDREKITKKNKWVDYNEYMAEDKVLYDSLSHLNDYGLLFLKNVPESEQSVVNIAERIGNLKDTFYGRTWDVKSKPKAENIAYTHQFLGLHMDLLYTSNPPHLQLLHSLRARAPRGESFFSDAYHAAQLLHQRSPFHFRTLCTFPVTYHYHHTNFHYHYTRPTIELHPYPKYSEPTNLAIKRVNWSPPFQGPFEARIGGENQAGLRNYLAAAHEFEKLLNAEENVDDDVFFSKLRVLEEKFEGRWTAEGVIRPAVI
ncbi:Clavaminate synthase-like protein [Aaosphaeria arxii CBS 175.79]|uniref:Clavaminate synthase-like protein n=1 Tax=Aaosphaeria arxii CBS 175.79 TaxID=1450172 RepID=A0A6A5XAE0_9PLEO|nr:Clavaminate synthase-like protein [Aaosphaeria arxii CBS 175.79]KAF2009826.1 Clavaminate synthase-like protein [Aaosphaeria arxii CBS 175.79]